MDGFRNIRLASRTVFWIVLIGLIVAALYVFFSSRIGQTALLICCSGLALLVVVGVLSERGMRQPQ
jgi:peptidoglycan/LPS O-acetylase OafA/YrhL